MSREMSSREVLQNNLAYLRAEITIFKTFVEHIDPKKEIPLNANTVSTYLEGVEKRLSDAEQIINSNDDLS